MAITIVFGREANIFGLAFRVTALEWFGVFAFMFPLISQCKCRTIDKDEDTYF